jgi:hypothetical protein
VFCVYRDGPSRKWFDKSGAERVIPQNIPYNDATHRYTRRKNNARRNYIPRNNVRVDYTRRNNVRRNNVRRNNTRQNNGPSTKKITLSRLNREREAYQRSL